MIGRRDVLHRFLPILFVSFSSELALQPHAIGQGYATVSVRQSSSSLSGTVSAGVSGQILEKVSVAACDKEYHQCSDITSKDKSGHFSIAPRKNQKIYYIRFSLYGMDPEEVTVTLKIGAGPLDITMIVAT